MHAAEAPKKQVTLLTIGDALEASLSNEYLVKGLIEPGTFNLLYGEPSCGKSFLALHLAFCVANAQMVFSRRVRVARVLYVAMEGERAFCRRIMAAHSRYKTASEINFFYVTEPLNLLSGEGHAEALVAAAREVNARLIFIDTLARAIGTGSENEPGDMGGLIEGFDFVRLETGAALMVIHHCGKDSSRGPRGHSSLLAAADTAMEVVRDDDGRRIRIVKCKDGIDGEAVNFELDVIQLGTDSDGDQVTSCAVRELTTSHAAADKSPQLTTAERGWFKDVIGLFLDVNVTCHVTPRDGMREVKAVTRDRLRDGFKALGRFALDVTGNLTDADRKTFSRMLQVLRDKGKIGMTDKYVWVLKNA